MDMTIVKINDLSGAALDWAVAEADKSKGDEVIFYGEKGQTFVGRFIKSRNQEFLPYEPSTDWEHGGPLIEKHRMSLSYFPTYPDTSKFWADGECYGASHLEAACRLIVNRSLSISNEYGVNEHAVMIPSVLCK